MTMIDLSVDSIREIASIPSPSLLVFRDRVIDNLRRMIAIAGSVDRLRPHAKTHKMEAIIRIALQLGISKHKCATIAEAEMIARAGGGDVLIAYPLVGPNIDRLVQLIDRYPETTFRATVDEDPAAEALSKAMTGTSRSPLSTLIDINAGMGRTGADVESAFRLYQRVETLPGLIADGLHIYDGQVRDADPAIRKKIASIGIEAALRLRDRLEVAGHRVPRLVIGGTPTFPIHADLNDPGVECSPGTCVLHDAGYGGRFPDLPFQPAAFLLTRVISRPGVDRLCLDLGHKAVSADPIGPRLTLIGLPGAILGGQSEEHLVVETPDAAKFPPGTPFLAIPMHICPTVALHQEAVVLEAGEIVDRWPVTARDRRIGI